MKEGYFVRSICVAGMGSEISQSVTVPVGVTISGGLSNASSSVER